MPLCVVRIFNISWRLLLRVAAEFRLQGRRGKPKAYMWEVSDRQFVGIALISPD